MSQPEINGPFVHPISGDAMVDRRQHCQSCINTYKELLQTQASIGAQLDKLFEELLRHAETPDQQKPKKQVVNGTTDRVELEKRYNASYPRERGADHPLRQLLEVFPTLTAMVNVDYKESGSKVEKLMAQYDAGELKPNTKEAILAEALAKVRESKEGKPKFQIKPINM